MLGHRNHGPPLFHGSSWLTFFAFETHHGEKRQQHREEFENEFGLLVKRCVWSNPKRFNVFILSLRANVMKSNW